MEDPHATAQQIEHGNSTPAWPYLHRPSVVLHCVVALLAAGEAVCKGRGLSERQVLRLCSAEHKDGDAQQQRSVLVIGQGLAETATAAGSSES